MSSSSLKRKSKIKAVAPLIFVFDDMPASWVASKNQLV
jgi:hypothetical protein